MRVEVNCNNNRWVYECVKVLAKDNLFSNETRINIHGLELHLTNGEIRYVICMTLQNNRLLYNDSLGKDWEKEAMDSLLSKGFYSTTDYSKWSQVVSDYDGMANMYGIPN